MVRRSVLGALVGSVALATATPSTLELAYNQAASVHITFNFEVYVGATVVLRDGGSDPASVPSVYAYSKVDATGRGADFLLSVGRWSLDGVPEPAGTPHTFYMDDWDCSVRIIPH